MMFYVVFILYLNSVIVTSFYLPGLAPVNYCNEKEATGNCQVRIYFLSLLWRSLKFCICLFRLRGKVNVPVDIMVEPLMSEYFEYIFSVFVFIHRNPSS